jgi:ribosomal protein L11 methyltransferase
MNEPVKWISVFVPASDNAFEAVSNFMFEQGALGTEERPEGILAYFRGTHFSGKTSRVLESYLEKIRLLGCDVGTPVWSDVQEEDWGAKWRDGFRPVIVTDRIVVKPPWEKAPAGFGGIAIDIYPRMAFGTGTHETTQLCLILLEKHLVSGGTVLDLGTGSGILAIAAAKLGAGQILGLDPDQDAIDNATENVRSNGVEDRVSVRLGSLETLKDVHRTSDTGHWKASSEFRVPSSELKKTDFRESTSESRIQNPDSRIPIPESRTPNFDLIVANIDRPTLTNLIPRLTDLVKAEGRMILSGILSTEKETIAKILLRNGWHVAETRFQGEWAGLVCEAEVLK